MKSVKMVAVVFGVILTFCIPAWGVSYIFITAQDAGEEHSVRKVWEESGIIWIGVIGEVAFTLDVTESSPQSIDTSWIYMDASYTTGTSRTFTASDYRIVHGVVVIKYDDDSYESKEFRIDPAWDPEATPATSSTPPTTTAESFPEDETASDIMVDVAAGAPDGPAQLTEYCVCDEGGCFSMIASQNRCAGTAPNCTGDLDC